MSRYVRVEKSNCCVECRRTVYVGEHCLISRAKGEVSYLCAHCKAMARRVKHVARDWSILLDTTSTVTDWLQVLVEMAEADGSPFFDELCALWYRRTRDWTRPDGSLMPVPELPTEADHEL